LIACATPGERFPVDLSYQGESPLILKPGSKVVVFPLDDRRSESELIGRHTHVFGRVDTFESSALIGKKVADLLVASLRQRGWDAVMAQPGRHPNDVELSGEERLSERVVSGTIQTLWAEATSHFGYTEIDAHAVLNIEIRDTRTGTTTTLKVDNQNVPKVVIFRPELLQDALSEVVSSGVNRVLR
jgi:hypothetical protein